MTGADPYVAAFVLAGLAAVVGLRRIQRLEHADTRRGLAGLFLVSGTWAFAQAARLVVPWPRVAVALYTLGAVVGLATAGAWLYFCSAYTGNDYHRRPWLRRLAVAGYLALAAVLLSNPLHGLHFQTATVSTPFPHVAVEYGALYWLTLGTEYAFGAVGFFLLFELFSESKYDATSLLVIAVLAVLPIGLHLAGYLRPDLLPQLNYVPLGVGGFALGVLYFVEEKFVAVSRFGRPQIVEDSPNPVVVLDRDDTVREVNAAAREHLPELAEGVDQPLASAAPRIAAALDADESVLDVPGEDGDATSYYKYDSTPLTVGATTIGRVVVLVDVTELESTRRELAKRTDLLAQTAELATIGGWELDLRTDTLTWEAETARIHGLAPSDTPAVEEAIEFYHPDDRETIRDAVAGAERGEPYDETCRIVRADGETRWVRTRGVPLFEGDEVVGVRGVLQDITDQREREQRLRRFQRAVEAAGHAIFITDTDGIIEHVNPAFESVTGYSAAEAVGKTPGILNSGEMDSEYFADLWETIESGEVWTEPVVNRDKSGDLYHADETIAPITTADGTTEGYVAIQTDITDRVEAEEELRTFERIVQRLEDPIMLQGTDGRFRVLNDALAEYAGLSTDELVGRDEFAFMDEDTAARIRARKEQVLDAERPVTYQVMPTLPEKGTRSFVTTRYPHYDEDGDIVGTIAICRDVTALRDREEQLRVLARVLRHNLRNEMSVVLGHAEMIAEGTADDPARLAERILDTGEDLVALADKERKLVELLTEDPSQQRIDLGYALEELAERSRSAHPLSEITVECPPDATVEAVPQLTDALAEVIENAALHADHDDPRVALTVTREDGAVRIAIRDNGPGIPETERRILSGDDEITPLRHGSGLGLRLVGQVVKQSGGSLRFAENDPTGSVVELVFPTDEAGADEPTA